MRLRLFVGCYRALMLLLPRNLRSRYGAEMLDVIRARHAEGRSGFAELVDLTRAAVAARSRSFGWVLVGFAAAHSAYAAYLYPKAIMGGFAVLLTAAALLTGAALLRRSSGVRQ
jgi:hypothetical protein